MKAVRYVADHPKEAAEMGMRGRQYAEQVLNLENCAKDVAAVIKRGLA